jgi:Rrf2 family protein
MKGDNRLSRMLHVLIHLGQQEGPATSELMAQMLNTNPVVVRRTMAGLREKGFVRAERGHGGGWSLARPLRDITLLDVYRAIDEPAIFALGMAEDTPRCLVEQAVNAALENELREAREKLLKRFEGITLATLTEDFERRARKHARKARCPV